MNIFKRQPASRQSTEPEPEPELEPMPIPQWIEEIITKVVIPPPPTVIFYCPMCGDKKEVPETDEDYRRGRYFCQVCVKKATEYNRFCHMYNMHQEQYNALRRAVYRYSPVNGQVIEYN